MRTGLNLLFRYVRRSRFKSRMRSSVRGSSSALLLRRNRAHDVHARDHIEVHFLIGVSMGNSFRNRGACPGRSADSRETAYEVSVTRMVGVMLGAAIKASMRSSGLVWAGMVSTRVLLPTTAMVAQHALPPQLGGKLSASSRGGASQPLSGPPRAASGPCASRRRGDSAIPPSPHRWRPAFEGARSRSPCRRRSESQARR